MMEKDFANDYQYLYWSIFKETGELRFMSLFMQEERARENSKKREIELGR